MAGRGLFHDAAVAADAMIESGQSVDASVDELFGAALALHRLSRVEEAARGYRQVLARAPRHAHALNFLAVIAYESHEFEETVRLTGRALDIDPRLAGAHLLRGHALVRLAQGRAAVSSYERAIALQPTLLDAHLGRAAALEEVGEPEERLAAHDAILALDPNRPEVHYNRGLALHELRRFDAAQASFSRVIALQSGYADAYLARANLHKDRGRFDAALEDYERAIGCRPDFALAYANRGNILRQLDRFEAALASYDEALAHDPDNADVAANRAAVLCDLGRYGEASESLERVVDRLPNHALAHFNWGLANLALGDLARGFREFEWRWRNEHYLAHQELRRFAGPAWRGEQSLAGKTLLVYCEQGLGDTIQFCRYVPLIAERGATVVFEVPPTLERLLASLAGPIQRVPRGAALPAFDVHCPLMSLPLALGTTLSSVPARIPYLAPRPERVEHWRRILGERRRCRVGLVWSGGFRPGQPELGPVNERRNIPLAQLAALRHPEVEFYSLQKGGLGQSGWDGPAMSDFMSQIEDFEDTAALIEQLDLVISVDTSTAHLAGALGKPVWLLNRFDTCWRWLAERTDSPWYPSLRLYRQSRHRVWEDVVTRVRHDLDAFVQSRP